MKTLFLMSLLALAGVQTAGAASLEGKILACTNTSFLGEVTTNYVFLTDGSSDVLARSSYFGSEVTDYKLSGTKVLIRDPGTDKYIAYDLRNPNAVTGSHTVCINPGQAGGDARPICQVVQDICTLK